MFLLCLENQVLPMIPETQYPLLYLEIQYLPEDLEILKIRGYQLILYIAEAPLNL